MGCLALGYTPEHSKIGLKVVGATGFEPATPCAQGRCATRLRYAPTLKILDSTADFCSSPLRVLRFPGENCPRTVPKPRSTVSEFAPFVIPPVPELPPTRSPRDRA